VGRRGEGIPDSVARDQTLGHGGRGGCLEGTPQGTSEFRLPQFFGKIETYMEPAPDLLPALFRVTAIGDAEIKMVFQFIRETHQDHGAVIGRELGEHPSQAEDGSVVPSQGGVSVHEFFCLRSDGPPHLLASGVRAPRLAIAELAERVGGVEETCGNH
jgi:hypothetical protein